MAQNDNVVFKTSTTATIDDLFTWNKSTGQIIAKTDNIPIVPGTVYFTSDGHIVHDAAQNNRLWMSKNAYSAVYAEDVSDTNTDIANAIKYSIHYVEGPTTDTTAGTWTGIINGITELYDGLTIIYVPAVAGGSSTTTLNINGLGAKTCYYNNTSAITTHYSVGTPILLTYRNNCWRRADYNSNTTYSAMSVAEMRAGTATSQRSIRADYLKTFLSTLGGTNLTLTHSGSAPYLQLNHDPSGITAGTYGNNSQQNPSYGGTFNIPYFTVDTQGHITNASTTTVKIPASDNTDYKVRQTPINSNDNNNYRILLSNSANDTSEDSISKKNANLIYNPTENKLSTGNIKLTGELDVIGNVYLRNQTTVDNLTAESLIVNGNSTFNNDINLAQGAVKWTSNSLPLVTSADYFLVIDAFANGGATKHITKANAIKSLISSSAIGSSTKPVYWTGSAFSAITSYSGAAALTGTPTAPTAAAGTSTTQIATTEFVTNAVAQGFIANDAMVFKGLIGSNQPITQLPTSGYNAGWTYRVANAGIFAGEYCEVGDLLIAINDGPASGSSVINTDWGKVEHNIDGAVFRGSGASNSSVGSSTQPVYVNGSGIITAITGAIANDTTGNAATATNATQLISNDRMDYGWNGINYFNIFTSNQSAAKVNDTPFSSNVWTHILRFNRGDPNGYYTDLAIPFGQDSIYYKRIAAGSLQNSTTNGGWIKVLDQLNYTSYTVTKTGSGASGTWNINISGNAATATALSSSGTINQFWRGDNRWSDTLGFIKINNEIKIKGYGDNNNYWHTIKDLTTVPLTNDRWHYLPNTTGWIVTSPTNGTGNNTTPIYIGEDGITRAITGTISNNTTGNADTATEFSSNTTVKLTGDATGESAGSKKGWSVPVTLANSGVAAGSYGPSANAEPEYGATFNVPYITVDAKGRVTSASTKTIKIPASDEQDHRDEGYGKITPAGDTGTSAVTANTTQITAKSYNEGFIFKTGNKWLTIAGTESGTTGSDILTIGHKAGLTAKNSYGSTATTASANNGTIKVTDVQYDEAGHITASTDRIITLSQVKNTAGATNSTAKLFLIGATTQGENPQTYSNNGIYIGNNNKQIVIESTSDASIKIRKFNESDNADVATISIYVDSSGQKGLYDGKNQKWIFVNSSDGTNSFISSNLRPSQINTYSLGSTDRYWNNIYVKDFFTKEAIESGTTYRTLMIGNETNRIGRISLYSGSKGGYIQQAINNTNNWILHQLPAESGWIVKAGNGTSTGTGDTETPIYVDTRGVAKPVNALPVNQNLLTNTQYYFNNNTSTKPIKKINTQDIPMPDCYSKYDIASSTSVTNLSLGTFAPAPDTWYTLSFYARANYNNTTIRTHFYSDTTASSYNCQGFSTTANDGTSNFTVSTEWKRYWVCYKTSASVSGTKNLIARLISGTSPGTTLRVALPKLEVGQIMTPWVPHANDFSQNKISTCYIDNHELNNYQWHRIATCSVGTTNYDDRDIILFVHKGYLANAFGILKISVRVDTNAVSPPIKLQAKWLLRHGFSESDCLIGLTRNLIDASSAATADIYFKTSTTYARIAFTALNNFNKRFTLFNSDEIAKTENGVKITDLANSTEVYIKENIMNGTTVESIKFKSDASSDTGITYVSWEYASDSLSEKSLIPIANNTYDLGSSSLKWNNIYANNFIGNAATATTLATGRTLKVNLASTSASTVFDGSANINDIGVSGTLPVAQGGTGNTTLNENKVLIGNGISAIKTTSLTVDSNGNLSNSTSGATITTYKVTNEKGSVALYVGQARGLYDYTKSKWIICKPMYNETSDLSDHTYINSWKNIGSARKSIYFNNNGEPVVGSVEFDDLVANRLVWTSAINKPCAGYHYANASKIAVNSTSEPSYNFYVNGTSYFNGNVTHNGFIYFANGTNYYIDNNATANLKRGVFAGTSTGETLVENYYQTGAIEIRESNRVRTSQTGTAYAPRIGFHWGNHSAASLYYDYDGKFYLRKTNGVDKAILNANLEGNADTATKATQDENGNNIINTYLTKTAGVTNITWDNTNKKLIKTINNSNSDIVTLYAANLKLNNTAVYNTELEIKNIKIGNGSISTSTKNVKLEYNETLEVLNFVFS